MSHVADTRFGIFAPDADLAVRLREEAARHWKLLLGIGILSIITGVFSILVPIVASISVAILVGWVLVVGGVIQLAHAFRGTGWEIAWNVILAVLTVIAGIWILLAPIAGTITLTIVLVAWFWVSGVMRLIAWYRVREVEGSWMLLLNGILNIALGVLIWADLPSSAAWAIGLLVGINLLFAGADLVMTAVVGRRLATVR
jgi:uncharacterized membrane protein HdeD (DUF308 family)